MASEIRCGAIRASFWRCSAPDSPEWSFRRTYECVGAAKSRSSQQTEAEVKSIVVLPFVNLNSDDETAFFSTGLSEELITDLSRVSSLRVISRMSSRLLNETTQGHALHRA